jgi:hypothetical protein
MLARPATPACETLGMGPQRRRGRGAAAVVAATLALAACGGHRAAAPGATAPGATTSATTAAPTTAAPTTTAPTTTAPTTTTTALPPAPQTSPYDAAQAFIDGWVAAKRRFSASVATAEAVRTLFAHAYAGQTVTWRGCTTTFLPRVCSFGPYGGGSGTLYQVSVRPEGPRWYVSSVAVETEG